MKFLFAVYDEDDLPSNWEEFCEAYQGCDDGSLTHTYLQINEDDPKGKWCIETLQYQDYVSHPMIWAHSKFIGVLLPDTFTPVDSPIPKEDELIKLMGKNGMYNHPIDRQYIRRFTMECAKILKVTNCQLQDYYVHKYPKTYSEKDIRKWFDDEWARREHSYRTRGCSPDEYSGDEDGLEFIENACLPVDSYNLLDPKVSYPKNFKVEIDGTLYYLLCQDDNGVEFTSSFSGD